MRAGAARPKAHGFSEKPICLGRERERQIVRDSFRACQSERTPRTVRIAGNSGAGKTTVLQAARTELDAAYLLDAACFESAYATPLGLVRRLLDSARLRVPDWKRYAGGLGPALARIDDDSLTLDAIADIENAVAQIFQGILYDRPVAMCIDDMQSADAVSVRLVRYALARADGPLFVLYTARERQGFSLTADEQTLFLDPLDHADAATLVSTAYPGASRDVIETICAFARGNPSTLEALSRQAARDGATVSSGVLSSLHDVVARDIGRVDEALRMLLQLCSILEQPVPARLLESVLGEDFLATWLPAAYESWLRVNDKGVEFVHDTLAQAVRSTITVAAPLHRRIVAAISADPALARNERWRLARSLGACGEHDRAFELYVEAAKAAFGARDFARAAAAYGAALGERQPPPSAHNGFYADYAQVLRLLNRNRDAVEVLRNALDDALDGGMHACVGRLAAQLLNALWYIDDHVALEAAFEHFLEAIDSDLERNDLIAARAALFFFDGHVDAFEATAARIRGETSRWATVDKIERARTFYDAYRGEFEAAMSRIRAYDLGLRARSGVLRQYTDYLELFAVQQQYGYTAALKKLGDKGLRLDANSLRVRLPALFAAGEWGAVEDIVARMDLAELSPEERACFLSYDAAVGALRRRTPAHAAVIGEELRDIARNGARKRGLSLGLWATAAASTGRPLPHDVTDALRHWLDEPVPLHIEDFVPLSVAYFAKATNDRPLLHRLAAYDAAEPRSRWRKAHALLAAGFAGTLIARPESRGRLLEAIDAFEQLDAPVFAAFAAEKAGVAMESHRKLLAMLGVGVAGAVFDEASPYETLSAREADVAKAVADGLKNREIAEQLAISERTVEVHLTHIFTKLGLRSRTELARWYLFTGGT